MVFDSDKMIRVVHCRRYLIRFIAVQSVFGAIYLISLTVKNDQNVLNSDFEVPELAKVISRQNIKLKKFTIADNYTQHTVSRLGLKELTSIAALEPDLGPVYNDVTSFTYSINNDVCDRFVEQVNRTLLVMIVSAASNFDKRRMIRQTWAATLQNSHHFGHQWARYAFLLGAAAPEVEQRVIKESQEYGDVIQLNLEDDYAKLSLKSVALLHWVTQFCPKVDFIFKCDDDIYVNVQQLSSVLSKISSLSNVYGSGKKGDKPNRYPENKYCVSTEEWPWPKYPAYLFGGAYLMGRDTVRPLLAAAQTTPFFALEDVYLTGLCTVKANLNVFISEKMYRRFLPKKKLDACFIRQTAMWQTQKLQQFEQSHNVTGDVYSQNIQCKSTEYTLF